MDHAHSSIYRTMNTLASFVASPEQLMGLLEVATLAELDKALVNLSASTQLVAWQRNQRIPASVNQDVLNIIFSLLIDRRGDTALRSVSQVCQQWQRVALESPLLWRKVLDLSANPPWMVEMLKRTRDVSLTIRISQQDFKNKIRCRNLANIADQFWRLETLEIDALFPYICEFFCLVPFDGTEVPRLRSLSLCGSSSRDLPEYDDMLPYELLALSAPSLEYLALDSCPFDWGALNSGRIRSFKLTVLHVFYPTDSDAPHALPVSELLAILAPMISLQELKLRNIFKANGEDLLTEWDTSSTTMFPALRILDIQANIRICSGFLNRVSAPNLVELEVECNATGDTSLFAICPFMSGISKVAPREPYKTLTAIYQTSKLWIALQGSQTRTFSRIVVPMPHNNGPLLAYIIRRLADMSSVHSAKRLKIGFSKDVHTKIMEDTWVYLLQRLNEVTLLDLGNYPVAYVLRTLYRNAKNVLEGQEQGETTGVLLPLLETIAVPASPRQCMLVDIIAELREMAGTPIDPYVMLREMDTYHDLRECIVEWLEGNGHPWSVTEDESESEGSEV